MKIKEKKSKEEAIKELGCKEKKCEFLDENSPFSFCKAIFTENCCLRKKIWNQQNL